VWRGMMPREIGVEYGLGPADLNRVLPEWRSPEWASAVNEPVYTRDSLGIYW